MFWTKAICCKEENCFLKSEVKRLEKEVYTLEMKILALQVPPPYIVFEDNLWIYVWVELNEKEKKQLDLTKDRRRYYYISWKVCEIKDCFSTYWEVKAYLKWLWVLLSN